VRHAHRARADNRHVFIGRPLNGLHGVPAVVAHEMEHVDTIDGPALTVRVLMTASCDESKQCAYRVHNNPVFLPVLPVYVPTPDYTATSLPRFQAQTGRFRMTWAKKSASGEIVIPYCADYYRAATRAHALWSYSGYMAPSDTTYTIVNEPVTAGHSGRFTLAAGGKQRGHLAYTLPDGKTMTIDYVEVDPSLRGQGVGKQLVDAAVAWAGVHDRQVVPLCSYARAVLARAKTAHPGA
jgi:predicted GNAT family acetyltransferase